ncbi:MAG TPA: hypothetical protein VFY40_00975 [Blastocatellia bacterium]|nr:hypothetical protein [Blastocatellia bacterium]
MAKTRTLGFDKQIYADLLADALPAAITNDEELERFTVIVDKLL